MHHFWVEAFKNLCEALQSPILIVEACGRQQWHMVEIAWIVELPHSGASALGGLWSHRQLCLHKK